MKGVLATHIAYDHENSASLIEIEGGLIHGILSTYILTKLIRL